MDDASSSISGDENQLKDFKTLISFYSNYFTNRVLGFLSSVDSSTLIGKISGLYHLAARTKSRRTRPRLPLPFPPHMIDSSRQRIQTSSVVNILEDIVVQIFSHLHVIQKNLQFWESKAQGTNSQKAYFMFFERGPRVLLDETVHLVRGYVTEGSHVQYFNRSATTQISEKIAVLRNLQRCLATFLAQVYAEVGRLAEDFKSDSDTELISLLVAISLLFSNVEGSIGDLHIVNQNDLPDPHFSFPLIFEKLPQGSENVDEIIDLLYRNLKKLESHMSTLVFKYQKPRKMSRYWIHYACGAVGLSVCSVWLVKHSSLMGSPDIDNWMREVRSSTVNFFNMHVEQPLLSIRDELFETFRKRPKGMMDLEEVNLTYDTLHRMLLDFTEQVKNKSNLENPSHQEMLEIVMSRYEKEVVHPIQNFLNGELARALLIQVQKLKLDIETAMLELDQIHRANEINFAILAALPAFILAFGLVWLFHAVTKQDTKAEGRGRISRRRRKLLLVDIEKCIELYQISLDEGRENESKCVMGLLLYNLDRLYYVVERHAKAIGEWERLKQEILDLSKPGIPTVFKLTAASRMGRMYECLHPLHR